MAKKKIESPMFLEPELAKAVVAARQGDGVSEVKRIRSVFLCAHCHEQITDEFVIGVETPVPEGEPDVFFHKNKPECRKASGESTSISYVWKCAQCKEPVYRSYKIEELSKKLQSSTLDFYCIKCKKSWPATREDVDNLHYHLAEQKGKNGERGEKQKNF